MSAKVLSTITPIIYQYGYITIIMTAILEGSSIPFPGTIVFIIAGFVVYKAGLNIWISIILAGLFYSIASILPYYIGKKIKCGIYHFLEKYFKVSRNKIVEIEDFFHKHGELSVCISRPFFIGNYISYFAGIANVDLLRFLILTFIGILPWATIYLWLGYYCRGNLDQAYLYIKKYKMIAVGVLLVIIIATILIKWYKTIHQNKDY